MGSGPVERTGVLVVRAWVEGDDEAGTLRARVTYTTDITSTEQVVTVATSIEEICESVRSWVGALLTSV